MLVGDRRDCRRRMVRAAGISSGDQQFHRRPWRRGRSEWRLSRQYSRTNPNGSGCLWTRYELLAPAAKLLLFTDWLRRLRRGHHVLWPWRRLASVALSAWRDQQPVRGASRQRLLRNGGERDGSRTSQASTDAAAARRRRPRRRHKASEFGSTRLGFRARESTNAAESERRGHKPAAQLGLGQPIGLQERSRVRPATSSRERRRRPPISWRRRRRKLRPARTWPRRQRLPRS